MGQIELFNHLLRVIISGYLKQNSCVQIIYITLDKCLINRITNVCHNLFTNVNKPDYLKPLKTFHLLTTGNDETLHSSDQP